MAFFKNLFSKIRKSNIDEASEWDRVQSEIDSLDMGNPSVREQYVLSCLEQMHEASAELDRVNDEYDLVTSYLTDMEEIENLTGPRKDQIVDIARHIHDLRKDHDEYVLTPSLISEADYKHIEAMINEVETGISKLEAEEDMRGKIKADLKRLDRERSAYRIRKSEVTGALNNAKGMAQVFMVAGAVLMLILLGMSLIGFEIHQLIYYAVIILLAVSVTIAYLKYADALSEKRKVENTINELILLENKVKIRYVNNKNLLDYLYIKYNVSSSEDLKRLYKNYLAEKEQRRKFERNEAVYEDEMARLIKMLRSIEVRSPEIWVHQTDALYDSREMVEVRHSLIGRRQKLRKQMEYNEQIALEASEEIKSIVRDYPQYSDSILSLVDAYDKKR